LTAFSKQPNRKWFRRSNFKLHPDFQHPFNRQHHILDELRIRLHWRCLNRVRRLKSKFCHGGKFFYLLLWI